MEDAGSNYKVSTNSSKSGSDYSSKSAVTTESTESPDSMYVISCDNNNNNNNDDDDFNEDDDDEDDSIGSVVTKENKFGLGVSRRILICLSIYLLNWAEIYQTFPEEFANKYSVLFTFINSKIRKYGYLNSFNMNQIIIYYQRDYILEVVKHIRDITSAVKRKGFKILMCLSLDVTYLGVIGDLSQKKSCLFDGALEKTELMRRYFCSSLYFFQSQIDKKSRTFNNNDPITLFDYSFQQELGNVLELEKKKMIPYFRYIPFNIYGDINEINKKEKRLMKIIVFKLLPIKEAVKESQNEWMYKLQREKERKRCDCFLESFLFLLNEEIENSRKVLSRIEEVQFDQEEEENNNPIKLN